MNLYISSYIDIEASSFLLPGRSSVTSLAAFSDSDVTTRYKLTPEDIARMPKFLLRETSSSDEDSSSEEEAVSLRVPDDEVATDVVGKCSCFQLWTLSSLYFFFRF
jgi:hypothetical protein